MKVYRSEKGERLIRDSYDKLLSRWDVPIYERDVETAYGMTHVIEAGARERPPLLLFHGVGDDAALMWVCNAGALSERFHVIAVDTLGGPGKSRPNARYAGEFDAKRWLSQLFEALGIAKADVAGVSYGCYLVQLLLAEMPERVRRAVGMAGLPAIEGYRESALRGILRFFPEALFPTEKNCRRLIDKMTGSNGRVFYEDQAIWDHWRHILRHFNQRAMAAHRVKPIDAVKLLAQRDKALFMAGACEVRDAERVAAIERKGFRLKLIEDAGHALNHERAELVNREILAFLTAR